MANQNPYQSILKSQSRGRSSRGESRFGNVDRSRLEPLENILSTAAEGALGKRQMELSKQKEAIENVYIDKGLGALNRVLGSPRGLQSGEVNKALDDATIYLLRHPGSRARQTASDIQKLRRQDKTDTSLTLEEAYLRGQIPFAEYEKIKKAGKTEPKDKVGFKWKQRVDKSGKSVTEKVGSKTHLVEEETDLQGNPTGATRLKGVSEARSSVVGFTSGGKGSMKIPMISGTGIVQNTTISGTPEDLEKQIRLQAQSIDQFVRKMGQTGGVKIPFTDVRIGADEAKEVWQDWIDEKIEVDKLPEFMQHYARAIDELDVKLRGLSDSADIQKEDEDNYGWQFENEE